MKKPLLITITALLLIGSVSAEPYPGSTTPAPYDADTMILSKINRLLSDAKTGDSPLITRPPTVTAGNDATSTAAAGTDWTALASHPAKQVTIINTTGTAISVRYGTGTGISLPTGTGYTFRGLTNSNGLQIKRTDDSNTQVSVSYNWESF